MRTHVPPPPNGQEDKHTSTEHNYTRVATTKISHSIYTNTWNTRRGQKVRDIYGGKNTTEKRKERERKRQAEEHETTYQVYTTSPNIASEK